MGDLVNIYGLAVCSSWTGLGCQTLVHSGVSTVSGYALCQFPQGNSWLLVCPDLEFWCCFQQFEILDSRVLTSSVTLDSFLCKDSPRTCVILSLCMTCCHHKAISYVFNAIKIKHYMGFCIGTKFPGSGTRTYSNMVLFGTCGRE